ncbi:MAG TPA: M1 family aminopeptidase [Bacteroidales bacterium]|nr:M1 family aminopeptidase [Bacteroidales bacterium]
MSNRWYAFAIIVATLWGNFLVATAQQEKAIAYYTDSSCYDVKSYELHLTATPDSLYLIGNTHIWAKVEKKDLSKFYIQLNDAFTVDSVVINGKLCTFEHNNHWIKATLSQKIGIGEWLQAIVYYRGYAVSSNVLGGIGIGTSGSNDCKVLYTLSEPYAALDFFACKQWVADKADSVKVYITTPRPYIAVANGLLQRTEDTQSGLRTFCWESHYPIAYYLIGFAVSEFKTYTYKFYSPITGDSVLFQNFHCYSDSEWIEQKNGIDRTVALIHYFETLTGTAYPFYLEKYGHVVVPIGGGMENQTITFLQNFDFTLVAHELAHSWFGNYVTCNDWQNIWINEGFATYLSYLAHEKFFPNTASDWLLSCLNLALRDSLATIYIPDDRVYDPLRIFSYTNTYMKGAYFLHTLRYFVGSDEIFFAVWKSFLQKFAFRNAGVEDFKAELEAKTGRSWSAFFQEWLYGKGYPIIQIHGRAQHKFLQLQGNVRASASDNRYSPIPVPIQIHFQNGRDTLIHLTLNDTTKRYSFLFASAITGITVDPKHWLMAKFDVSFAIDTTPPNSMNVFPNPFRECFQVIFPEQNAVSVSKRLWIYNPGGQQLFSLRTNQPVPQCCPRQLGTGVYLLVAEDNERWYVQRILKQ